MSESCVHEAKFIQRKMQFVMEAFLYDSFDKMHAYNYNEVYVEWMLCDYTL